MDEQQIPGPNGIDRTPSNHYAPIEIRLAYQFIDSNLLQRALTHRSVQGQGAKSDYERLEFLGDAVLDLAIAELLLEEYPEAREGELSKMRAALVNTNSLAEVARALELSKFIRLSRSEQTNGGSERPSILADVFEALMGAVYKEAGFERVRTCIKSLFSQQIKGVVPRDPKTELQELLHARGFEAPVYLLEAVEGPEHAPTFVSIVQINGKISGRGHGATKKASQQLAAAEALCALTQESSSERAA